MFGSNLAELNPSVYSAALRIDLEGVINVVGVDVADVRVPGERHDETELHHRHREQLRTRLRSTFREHGRVAHVQAEHVEEDGDGRQVGEHGHEEVAVVTLNERRVVAERRRESANGEQVERRQTDAEERQSQQHETDADSRVLVE